MTPRVLGDADIERMLPPERALSLIRAAVLDAESGRLTAPPRVSADVGVGRLTFTVGAVEGEWLGYRSYLAPGDRGEEQLVVVQDLTSGRVRSLYAGVDLGPRRTGAIGGVVVDALVPAGPVDLAVVGAGRQAWEQVRAIAAARIVSRLRVYSRSPGPAQALAHRAGTDLGLDAAVTGRARRAVEGAEVVVLATSASAPVIESGWVRGAHLVSTLGPKQRGRHEFPLDLVTGARALVCDSPAQLDAYDPPSIVGGLPDRERVLSLGAALRDGIPAGDPGAGPAVFLSVGLAGTEAYLLDAITR